MTVNTKRAREWIERAGLSPDMGTVRSLRDLLDQVAEETRAEGLRISASSGAWIVASVPGKSPSIWHVPTPVLSGARSVKSPLAEGYELAVYARYEDAGDEFKRRVDSAVLETEKPSGAPTGPPSGKMEPVPGRPGVVATDGIDPEYDGQVAPKGVNPETGMHRSYYALSEEERAKGFVRPVRRSYRHVGVQPRYPTRPLTEAERNLHSPASYHDYVVFEPYPDGEETGKAGRFWTRAQLDSGCGAVTTMDLALAETFARDPNFYRATYCATCKDHFDVGEFAWDGTDERVGT